MKLGMTEDADGVEAYDYARKRSGGGGVPGTGDDAVAPPSDREYLEETAPEQTAPEQTAPE